MKRALDHIPDRETKFGRAWRCSIQELERRKADVACWVLDIPWAHPAWSFYMLTAIHLRPFPGQEQPSVIRSPKYTHQVFLFALDPRVDVDLHAPGMGMLSPINFSGQWQAGTDFEAERKIESIVDEILAGNLSPDTDYIRMWIERFSNSEIIKAR